MDSLRSHCVKVTMERASPRRSEFNKIDRSCKRYVDSMSNFFCIILVFSDKCGKLALSPKQRGDLREWVRPEQFCDNPQIIYAVSCYSIKQVSWRSSISDLVVTTVVLIKNWFSLVAYLIRCGFVIFFFFWFTNCGNI